MSFSWRWARRAAGFAAVCYVGLHIRIPGIRPEWLSREIWDTNDSALLRLFDRMTGSGVSGGTVLALGIAPYLVARTYMWGAKKVFPRLAVMDADEAGHDTLKRWTRLLTVVLALIQSFGYAQFLQTIPQAVSNPGAGFVAQTMAFLTIASVTLMWLSERIAATNDDAVANDATTTERTLDAVHAPAALNAPRFVAESLKRRVVDSPAEVHVPK